MKTAKKRGHRRSIWVLVVLLLSGAYGYRAVTRSLPPLQPMSSSVQLRPQSAAAVLPWPSSAETAVGINNEGVLASNGAQKPLPTASTAKVLTALCVLAKKPLQPGQPGPTITLSEADAALYNSYVAQEGSVVPVAVGEQISEYQMLEAMMLPSANNIADSLAMWAFGSLNAYSAYANVYAKQHGMVQTHVGQDASGFSPDTVSSAHDLVLLGEAAMQQPVLAEIVGKQTTDDIPLVDSVENVNFLLGTDAIVGIKTGNTDQAGGVFISASRTTVNNKPVTIITATAGAPTLSAAMNGSLPLIRAAQTNFASVPIIEKGAIVGSYAQPWGGKVTAVAAGDLTATAWKGSAVTATIKLQPIAVSAHSHQTVGSLLAPKSTYTAQESTAIVLAQAPTRPPLWWRLTHVW